MNEIRTFFLPDATRFKSAQANYHRTEKLILGFAFVNVLNCNVKVQQFLRHQDLGALLAVCSLFFSSLGVFTCAKAFPWVMTQMGM